MAPQSPLSAPVPGEASAPRAVVGDVSFQAAREEQLLVQALRERDEAAFERVLDRWYSAMLRTAMIYVGSRARAEEVVQETWLAVLGGIDRFDNRSSLKTWIFRILVNRAKTTGTRDARMIPLSSLGRDRATTTRAAPRTPPIPCTAARRTWSRCSAALRPWRGTPRTGSCRRSCGSTSRRRSGPCRRSSVR